jgi:hypothetical protein
MVSLPGYESADVADMLAFLYGRLQEDPSLQLSYNSVFSDLKLGSFR